MHSAAARATAPPSNVDGPGDATGDLADARHLGRHRAQLGLKDHVTQPRGEIVERLLAVLAEEEAGVGQARRQHPLVARADDADVAGHGAGDGDEAVGQRAAALFHGEVALVRAHRRHDDLVRHLEERLVEAAADGHRILDQVGHLVEKGVVGTDAGAGLLLDTQELGLDHLAANVGIGDDERLAQRALVGVGARLDRQRRRRKETVPAAVAAGPHAEQLHRQHRVTEQRDDPVDRAHERAGARAPAHRLGPRQLGRQAGEHRRQHLGRRQAGDQPLGDQVVALLARDLGALQGVGVQSVLAREAEGRLGRLAGVVERHPRGRTDEPLAQIRLAIGQPLDRQRQAPGRAQHPQALVIEAGLRQRPGGQALEVAQRAGEEPGRDLLGADLEQQISRHGRSPPRGHRRPRAPRPGRRR